MVKFLIKYGKRSASDDGPVSVTVTEDDDGEPKAKKKS